MRSTSSFLILALAAMALIGCTPTMTPDYTVKVMSTLDGSGYVAVPPPCPSWIDNEVNPFDGQPLPQFGCANARNLANMVEQPGDLIKGRDLGPAVATTAATAMDRYNTNKTTPLINPSADSATSGSH